MWVVLQIRVPFSDPQKVRHPYKQGPNWENHPCVAGSLGIPIGQIRTPPRNKLRSPHEPSNLGIARGSLFDNG